jgi:hypothetical protein
LEKIGECKKRKRTTRTTKSAKMNEFEKTYIRRKKTNNEVKKQKKNEETACAITCQSPCIASETFNEILWWLRGKPAQDVKGTKECCATTQRQRLN